MIIIIQEKKLCILMMHDSYVVLCICELRERKI